MKTTSSLNTQSINAVTDSTVLESPPTNATYKAARFISNVGSPPVTGLLAVIVSIYATPGPLQLRWGLLYIAIAVVIPIVYVLELVRRGQVTDFHLSSRTERMKPFFVTLGTAVVAWLLFRQATVSRALQLVATINVVQTTLLWLITTRWKISIHTTAATGLAVLTSYIAGGVATPLFFCVPIIGWSRVYMKRHTLAQVIAGTMLGAVLVYSAVQLHGI